MEHGTLCFFGQLTEFCPQVSLPNEVKCTIHRIQKYTQEHGTLCFIGQPTFANPDQPHAFPFSETLFCRRV